MKKGRNSDIESMLKIANSVASRMHWIHGMDKNDMVQEALIGVIRGVDTYNPNKGASLRTWCYTKASGFLKDAIKLHVKIPYYNNYDETIRTEMRHVEVNDLLDRLNPQERFLIIMYYKHGYTLKEIGSQFLEVSESRACQIRSKALRKMKAKKIKSRKK